MNEVLLSAPNWQETVKNFAISMWLQDIVSPVIVGVHWWDQKSKDRENGDDEGDGGLGLDERCIIYENLETLRGINVLNFN